MKKSHKHAELIKAWADGAEIECRNKNFQDSWSPLMEGCWDREFLEFRIKPQPKPDQVIYPSTATSFEGNEKFNWYVKGDLKLVFDGETGKLKSAEVL